MTTPLTPSFVTTDIDQIKDTAGMLAVFVPEAGTLDATARRVNRLTRGAVARLVESDSFAKIDEGKGTMLAYPVNVAAEGVIVIKLARRPDVGTARKAGATIAKLANNKPTLALCGNLRKAEEVALGLALRVYDFNDHFTKDSADAGPVRFMVNDLDATTKAA